MKYLLGLLAVAGFAVTLSACSLSTTDPHSPCFIEKGGPEKGIVTTEPDGSPDVEHDSSGNVLPPYSWGWWWAVMTEAVAASFCPSK